MTLYEMGDNNWSLEGDVSRLVKNEKDGRPKNQDHDKYVDLK